VQGAGSWSGLAGLGWAKICELAQLVGLESARWSLESPWSPWEHLWTPLEGLWKVFGGVFGRVFGGSLEGLWRIFGVSLEGRRGLWRCLRTPFESPLTWRQKSFESTSKVL